MYLSRWYSGCFFLNNYGLLTLEHLACLYILYVNSTKVHRQLTFRNLSAICVQTGICSSFEGSSTKRMERDCVSLWSYGFFCVPTMLTWTGGREVPEVNTGNSYFTNATSTAPSGNTGHYWRGIRSAGKWKQRIVYYTVILHLCKSFFFKKTTT